MKKNITIMESKLKDLEHKATTDPTVTIKASEKIFPGVTIRIAGATRIIEMAADHCTVYFNPKSQEIDIGPY
jgi:uncharacterized protein (DUF342 family)